MTDPEALLASLPPEAREEVIRQARTEAWRRGELSYKFHATQHSIYAALKNASRRKFFLLCSRRLGKTFTLLCLAFEQAIKKPRSVILYLAPFASMASEIVTDGLRNVMTDPDGFQCPEFLGIEVKPHQKEIHFRNGSVIRLKGVNAEQADNIRGGTLDLVILDECGQMDRLEYLVSSVAVPATMTTDGRIILATTPAVSPDHDSSRIYLDLKSTGDAVKFTLLDAPEKHIPRERKAEFLLEAKERPEHIDPILDGEIDPKGTTALREYFCALVSDSNLAVVPEFREAKKEIVRTHQRPPLFDAYVGIDVGQVDKTALVFGVYDFRAGVVYIEDEALLHRPSTSDIAKVLLEKEYELWVDQKPHLRVVDNDLRLIGDLYERHGVSCTPALKAGAKNSFNLLRTMITNRELVISPKCERLCEHLENAVFNNKGTAMARSGEGEERHHFDLLDALRYMLRSVNFGRNPYPQGWNGPRAGTHVSRRVRPAGVSSHNRLQLDLLGNTPAARRLKKKT